MPIVRSERDEALLETLVFKVRLLSAPLIADAWWSDSAKPLMHARRRLRQLIDAKLIEHTHVLASPMLPMEAPLHCWQPGAPEPDCEALGYALQSRWGDEPPRRVGVFVAAKKAVYQYGGRGKGGLRQRLQATHDLHLSAVYLYYLRTDPAVAAAWVGEDMLGKAGHGIKDPDAIVMNPDGNPRTVIEFGGRYDARRVRDFHQHCARFGLGYELW